MKKIFFASAVLLLVSVLSHAQPFRGLDKSPMDMAYFPDNFAHDRKAGEEAVVRVTYSRPAKNGREIFGSLIPYGKVWRAGANEASEIKVYKDIEIGGKKLKAGTYSFFAIPGEKEWTLIFNSDLDYWGAYRYKASNDVLRVTAPVRSLESPVENFTIQFKNENDKKGIMMLAWDKTLAELPFSY